MGVSAQSIQLEQQREQQQQLYATLNVRNVFTQVKQEKYRSRKPARSTMKHNIKTVKGWPIDYRAQQQEAVAAIAALEVVLYSELICK